MSIFYLATPSFRFSIKNGQLIGLVSNHQKIMEVNDRKDKKMELMERKEIDNGILEYVSKGPGFNAIIKQRYSDYQVK